MKTKKVRREHLKNLEQLLFLAQYHKGLAANAEANVANILKMVYDVDISREDWELDFDNGKLVYKGDRPLTGVIDIDALARERGLKTAEDEPGNE